ncbi:MAG TPA: ribokinase, partial [Clostridia bacterium]|nr:ribokinase [Clostridia bacterium]
MKYDTLIIGQVCLDTNTDYDGAVAHSFGGAVLFSGHAAAAMGNAVAVLPKCNCSSLDLKAAFAGRENITVFPLNSGESTLMENTYFTADRERRLCRCAAMIE